MTGRFEIKSVIQPYEMNELECWLHKTGLFFKAYNDRSIHSVYLDTLDLNAAKDNLDGLGKRSKYRLRWYNGNLNDIRFEVKLKRGRLGSKLISPFKADLSHFLACSDHERSVILADIEAVKEFGSGLHMNVPVLQVNYWRSYYHTYGGIRLTIDRDLSFNDLRNGVCFQNQPDARSEKIIVELKFDPGMENDVASMMKEFPFYPTRNSKYVLGLSLLTHAYYL